MNSFDLDTTLIELHGENGAGEWTVRDAVEGVQIFGGIGSGKTSGSGRMIALKYLKAGFGGLVLTVKPDEKEDWVGYARLAGREDDLIVVEPNGKSVMRMVPSGNGGVASATFPKDFGVFPPLPSGKYHWTATVNGKIAAIARLQDA